MAAVSDLLYNQPRLLGVSGASADMRELLASDAREATEASALLVYRIWRQLGSLIPALQELDALIFTGGIGERPRGDTGTGVHGSRMADQ